MKKFSNIEEKQKVLTIQKPKINKLIDYLIKENIQVSYKGEENEILNKKIEIKGSDILSEKINLFIEKLKTDSLEILSENLKYHYGNQHDQKQINKLIESYILHEDIIPSPFDIFSNNDYEELVENTLVLKSLNTIPLDYLDFINNQNIEKFFENGNKIKLKYSGPNSGWEVYFENNNVYGTVIDSNEEKYKNFVIENNEFISDFLYATKNLIGAKNLYIDKFLISQF